MRFDPLPSHALSRRRFLVAGGGALAAGLLAACTKKSPPAPGQSSSGDTNQLSILGTGQDAPPIQVGQARFAFFLVDAAGQAIGGGSPTVSATKAGGTPQHATATFFTFSGYQQTGDHSPKTPFPGFYSTDLSFDAPGVWTVKVSISENGKTVTGTGLLTVSDTIPHAVGSQAVSTATPVAKTDARIAEICTRDPVDHLHAISLADALTNGKPTVVTFATPLLCQSQQCGPVVDEVILVSQQAGEKANFIHVEEFLPGPGHSPPAPTLENQAPAFHAWELTSEPWVFVIDKGGAIRFSTLGPVAAPEIAAALQPLL
jgi:hypothetical protein